METVDKLHKLLSNMTTLGRREVVGIFQVSVRSLFVTHFCIALSYLPGARDSLGEGVQAGVYARGSA